MIKASGGRKFRVVCFLKKKKTRLEYEEGVRKDWRKGSQVKAGVIQDTTINQAPLVFEGASNGNQV